jgi:chromosome segregation ATPase
VCENNVSELQMPEQNGAARLDRIERILETLADDQRQLLTAQILTNDQLQRTQDQLQRTQDQLQRTQDQLQGLATEVQDLAEFRRRTEQNLAEITDKLNGLIAVVDGMIRKPPPQ